MSIDTVIGTLAESIERALVLYDCDLSVVAYSAHSGDVDQARRMAILERRGTRRARQMMRVHGAASHVGPLHLPAEGEMPERVVYPVRHDGYLQGYLVYVELGSPREIPPPIRAELDRHAAELGRLLHARALDSRENQARLRTLTSDLVSDDAARRSTAARTLVAEDLLPVAPEYTGFVLVPVKTDGVASTRLRTIAEAALLAFMRAARQAVAGAVIEDGAAVAVMAGSGGAAALPALPAQFARRGDMNGVGIGVGSPVPELSDAAASVRQARIAAKACRLDPQRYSSLARWQDLGIDRLLLQLPLEQLTLGDLPTPVALLLDAVVGPDLASTVEAYLDCAGDAQATAARLMIHRSTFYYRLDRARQVAGVDLHDGETRRELHTGLRVARLAGLRPRATATA